MANEYDKDLYIDPNALDVECLKQPRLYMKYAEKLADARKAASLQAERLDVVKAEADRRVRTQFADQKVTVDQVRAAIAQDPEVQEAAKKAIELDYEVNILQSAVRAFDQKKDMLEAEIRLHGQMYFAGPSVPRDIGAEFVKTMGEKRHEGARDETARRTRRGN